MSHITTLIQNTAAKIAELERRIEALENKNKKKPKLTNEQIKEKIRAEDYDENGNPRKYNGLLVSAKTLARMGIK
jgi:hypothetical protein